MVILVVDNNNILSDLELEMLKLNILPINLINSFYYYSKRTDLDLLEKLTMPFLEINPINGIYFMYKIYSVDNLVGEDFENFISKKENFIYLLKILFLQALSVIHSKKLIDLKIQFGQDIEKTANYFNDLAEVVVYELVEKLNLFEFWMKDWKAYNNKSHLYYT